MTNSHINAKSINFHAILPRFYLALYQKILILDHKNNNIHILCDLYRMAKDKKTSFKIECYAVKFKINSRIKKSCMNITTRTKICTYLAKQAKKIRKISCHIKLQIKSFTLQFITIICCSINMCRYLKKRRWTWSLFCFSSTLHLFTLHSSILSKKKCVFLFSSGLS